MNMSRKVGTAMTRSPVTVGPNASATHVAWLLEKYRIGAVPVVVASNGRVVGIVTKGDLISGITAGAAAVSEIMTASVVSVSTETPVREAVRLMVKHRFGRLPVTDEDGRLLGIVSRTDLLAGLLPSDAEIRREVVDRVLDAGGEVCDARVDHGVVWLYGRVGERHQGSLVEHMVRRLDGVVRVNAVFTVCDDDRRELVRG